MMDGTNIALYEALKEAIGPEAATMIAEVVPPARELATKADVSASASALRTEMADLGASLRTEMADLGASLRAEIHRSQVSTIKWLLGFWIPLWAGTWGTMVAVLFKT